MLLEIKFQKYKIWALLFQICLMFDQRYAPHPTYILANLSNSVASIMQWLTTPSVDSGIVEIAPLIFTYCSIDIENEKVSKNTK